MTNGIIFSVCSISAISVLQFVLKRWQKDYNKIQEKSESQRNRDQLCALLQGLPRICHPRRQKARGREAMEIKVPGVRKLRKRIERSNSLWAATQKTVPEPVHLHKQFVESSYSARYSKWDDDKAWSPQEWKADTSMCDRPGQLVVTSWGKTHESQLSFFHEKTQHDGTSQSVVNEVNLVIERGNPL